MSDIIKSSSFIKALEWYRIDLRIANLLKFGRITTKVWQNVENLKKGCPVSNSTNSTLSVITRMYGIENLIKSKLHVRKADRQTVQRN